MKFVTLLVAFASVTVAAPVQDGHTLQARGFLPRVMNPRHDAVDNMIMRSLHDKAQEQHAMSIARKEEVQGSEFNKRISEMHKPENAEGFINAVHAHHDITSKFLKESKIGVEKSNAALNAQDVARQARKDVLRPTGFFDFFHKIGKAVSTSFSSWSARRQANSQLNQVRQHANEMAKSDRAMQMESTKLTSDFSH